MGLGVVELMMAIEDEFRVTVPSEAGPRLVRVGDWHEFLVAALHARGEPVDPAVVWDRLRRVVVAQTAAAESEVVPKTRIATDLDLR